jgi:hypothetical protein
MPTNATLSQIVQGQGGYLAGGFFPVSGPIVTAVRFNASFTALAAPPDTSIPGFGSNGVDQCFHVPGRFIILDGSDVADSTDGVTWTLGSGVDADLIDGNYTLVYDDLHSVIVVAISVSGGDIAVGPDTSPLAFTQHLGVTAEFMGCIGYKGPGTGIILGVCGPGGAAAGEVFKSVNGGTVWTLVGHLPNFGSSNTGFFIGRGVSHWLSVGDDGHTSQYTLSTDDGATWSAAAPFPNGGGLTTSIAAVATDGAGNWVVATNGTPPDNYWVSNDDGVTWTSPNLFAAQGGIQPSCLLWNGSEWLAVWVDPTQSFDILASSPDGHAWTTLATLTTGAPTPVIVSPKVNVRPIDPRNMDPATWCNLMVQNMAPLVNAPRVFTADGWRDWANSVVSSPEVQAFQPPNPNFFDNWQEWAERFVQAVGL